MFIINLIKKIIWNLAGVAPATELRHHTAELLPNLPQKKTNQSDKLELLPQLTLDKINQPDKLELLPHLTPDKINQSDKLELLPDTRQD